MENFKKDSRMIRKIIIVTYVIIPLRCFKMFCFTTQGCHYPVMMIVMNVMKILPSDEDV